MEDRWLTWAKELLSIAAVGSHFTEGKYDAERYRRIAGIANDMLAALGGVPLERIEALVGDITRSYATPLVDVRAAVFRGDSILLVREVEDGLWTLPGGFADVGRTPRENVEKEVLEEASLRVRATHLYSLRHKARHPYLPDVRDFYKLFFLCEPLDEGEPAPGMETSGAGFFARDALPALSTGRTIEADVGLAFDARGTDRGLAWFD